MNPLPPATRMIIDSGIAWSVKKVPSSTEKGNENENYLQEGEAVHTSCNAAVALVHENFTILDGYEIRI